MSSRSRGIDEVQGEKTHGRIERAGRGAVDVALVQPDAGGKRLRRGLGQAQHLRRRVDAVELPACVGSGEMFELQPAAGAEDQHAPVIRRALGQEQLGHPVEIRKPGHLPGRPVAVARDRIGVGERAHRALDTISG